MLKKPENQQNEELKTPSNLSENTKVAPSIEDFCQKLEEIIN